MPSSIKVEGSGTVLSVPSKRTASQTLSEKFMLMVSVLVPGTKKLLPEGTRKDVEAV